MIELYVFDQNLEVQGEVSEYVNIEIERNFNTYSKLILNIQATRENVLLLREGYIMSSQTNQEYGYIIQHVSYLEDGSKTLEVVAFSLNFILSYRSIYPQQYHYGTHEENMRYFIQRNCITPDNPDRIIPNLVLGPINGIGFNGPSTRTGGSLLDHVMNVGKEVNATVDILINFTTRQLEVVIHSAVNRSINQDVNSKVIFSDEFDNVLKQDYYYSLISFKNTAIIAGEGEGVDRRIVDINGNSGLGRRELFVDARDLQSTYKDDNDQDVTLTPIEYTNALVSRGNDALLDTPLIETFEAVIDDSQFTYGVHYFVGDIVSVRNDLLGLTVDVPVTSVNIVSNRSGVNIVPSLGTGLPDLYNRGGVR